MPSLPPSGDTGGGAAILIPAAGLSSRMRGADKLAEPVGGVPLLARVAGAAAATGCPVFVALPAADHPRAALLAGLPVQAVVVPEAAEGLGGTLRGGVARLPDCARFMVLLADLPGIGAGDIRAVLAAPSGTPSAVIWRGATSDGRPGHPILFDASLRPRFADLAGDSGGEAIVRAEAARTVLVPLPGDRARLDLDTPEDWAAFRARP
jgi:CTP:molybdopterin cytidylyltransferase MocA